MTAHEVGGAHGHPARARSLQLLGFEHPRVAVAGLNPHADEAGLFGTQDRDKIAPPVEARVG